jgi:hypothetical protein
MLGTGWFSPFIFPKDGCGSSKSIGEQLYLQAGRSARKTD